MTDLKLFIIGIVLFTPVLVVLFISYQELKSVEKKNKK
tara:strand:- start:313 stop:426 length:114 start_codon:yes stop_codon:yes gene_type:complete